MLQPKLYLGSSGYTERCRHSSIAVNRFASTRRESECFVNIADVWLIICMILNSGAREFPQIRIRRVHTRAGAVPFTA